MLKKKMRRLKQELILQHGNMYPYRRFLTNNNCIFVHIPKAAGTSILQALTGETGWVRRDHATAMEFRKADKIYFEESFKFTFTRHPVTRLHSAFNYLSKGGNGTNNQGLANHAKRCSNFDEFVKEYVDSQMMHHSLLCKPQIAFLCDEDGDLLVDFIGRYENIEDDFKTVCERLKINSELSHVNKSTGNPLSISEESAYKIYRLYQKDFEMFDYSIEDVVVSTKEADLECA